MPVTANTADVIISNCVLNLVPDKAKAFAEIFRVMKPGGHLSVSDVVIKGELPQVIKSAAEMYAGCVAGAIDKDEYIKIMEKTGFKNIKIQKERAINLPDEILLQYMSKEDLQSFRNSGMNVLSVNVYAEKFQDCGCAPGCCS
jgi:ubiquinone/menaquinone biosynthesis C-methylase UbiE